MKDLLMPDSLTVEIPHNGKDLSTYSKVLSIYTRNSDSYQVNSIQDKQKTLLGDNWKSFATILKDSLHWKKKSTGVAELIIHPNEAKKYTNLEGLTIKVSEYKRANENQIRGIVTTVENENEFSDWLVFHLLSQARLSFSQVPQNRSQLPYDELFTNYFAQNLKNTTANDEWDMGGRDNFIANVRYFTDRLLRIECIIPAFPCKSSNAEKVYGAVPDKGEELALRRLITVTREVQNFYPPGMKIWIVSDGHVFSDCIGVDDDVVDCYTAKLHELYQKVSIPGIDAIGFAGLKELFFTDEESQFNEELVKDIELPHRTGTKICEPSELSRKILMKGFDTDNGKLRQQILTQHHPRLHLFRGFSKFMMDDLRLLPQFQKTSKKAFKKVVSKVAFEMIKRNDAYSNLVELIFPHHMRLSIHAHTNFGPKFGIRMISSRDCQVIKCLDNNEEPRFEDLLHIPTPWHNCVLKLEDEGKYFLTKSKVVIDAIESGIYEGHWKEPNDADIVGGHFVIRRKIDIRKKLN
ncbi:LAFE_0F15764g1_1 [Lachancea fermentati]|uniref:LAFE_0F15764g1_1 n=1 Tax=Lachancea fermentati TaxID=4955 RepID=A0A1G4MG70_LACFM|nr:LAFE_0F15764g1_1 [Lachancea fermentati]